VTSKQIVINNPQFGNWAASGHPQHAEENTGQEGFQSKMLIRIRSTINLSQPLPPIPTLAYNRSPKTMAGPAKWIHSSSIHLKTSELEAFLVHVW